MQEMWTEKEVVQLYMSDEYASMTRPVKELKHFEKQFIKVGETKTFRFDIDLERDFGFVNEMDKRASVQAENGVKFGLGIEVLVAKLKTWDVLALCDALIAANKTENPKISEKELETYIEDENTDIDQLFESVIEGLKKSNVTRKKVQAQLREMEEVQGDLKE